MYYKDEFKYYWWLKSNILIASSVNGERAVGDLRVVVFSSEFIFTLFLMILLVFEPCEYELNFIKDNYIHYIHFMCFGISTDYLRDLHLCHYKTNHLSLRHVTFRKWSVLCCCGDWLISQMDCDVEDITS